MFYFIPKWLIKVYTPTWLSFSLILLRQCVHNKSRYHLKMNMPPLFPSGRRAEIIQSLCTVEEKTSRRARSVSSVKLLLLTMPRRCNQSSLEDIQQHTMTTSINPTLRLPRYSANISDDSNSSQYDSTTRANSIFLFPSSGFCVIENHKPTISARRHMPKQQRLLGNQMNTDPELRWLTTLTPHGAAVALTVYIHCFSCMIMCFWVVLKEIRVQSVL